MPCIDGYANDIGARFVKRACGFHAHDQFPADIHRPLLCIRDIFIRENSHNASGKVFDRTAIFKRYLSRSSDKKNSGFGQTL